MSVNKGKEAKQIIGKNSNINNIFCKLKFDFLAYSIEEIPAEISPKN